MEQRKKGTSITKDSSKTISSPVGMRPSPFYLSTCGFEIHLHFRTMTFKVKCQCHSAKAHNYKLCYLRLD